MVITDSVARSHTIDFQKLTPYVSVIRYVNIEVYKGTRDTYTFSYDQRVTDLPIPQALKDQTPGYNTGEGAMADKIVAGYLTSLLLPDGSHYSMPADTSYIPQIQQAGKLAPGALIRMTLPTGASLEWDYQVKDTTDPLYGNNSYGYYFSPGFSGRQASRLAPGVRRRRIITKDASGADIVVGQWKYDPHIGTQPPGCVQWAASGECGAYDIVNKVTEPTGDYTNYYYSIFPEFAASRTQSDLTQPTGYEYGLPFTKDPSKERIASDNSFNPLFLST